MAATSSLPTWYPVAKSAPEPTLKIQNTLTRSKVEFHPKEGRTVKWYNCGPTVYDHSHLGHARNYVSQDVIRRILSEYFNYDVFFVMNITDIEDKIIQASRKKYLFSQFRAQHGDLTASLVSLIRQKWSDYFKKHIAPHLSSEEYPGKDDDPESVWGSLLQQFQSKPEFKQACLRKSEKFEMNITILRTSYDAILQAEKDVSAGQLTADHANKLVDASYDVLTYSLDIDLKHTTDSYIQKLSKEHSSFWEDAFMKDMKALRVLPPDLLTRVTEYVPEVVDFIAKIMERGLAYAINSDVYFDTQAFDGAALGTDAEDQQIKHWYLKLEPWSKNNSERAEEGEGTLAVKQFDKRSNSDFVLWKSSRPGEPSWPSPWGPGRPGWHIECSVMASEAFGDNMDIHSGGEDLAFPHHDNELAQSEAFHGCKQWVNYFIHTGHLHIEGLKMSKSLKNFITVQDILKRYTARQLRLAFMSQLWSSKMDFQESLMNGEVKSREATIDNFFTTVKAILAQGTSSPTESPQHNYRAPEKELIASLLESQRVFRAALCDSFNIPEALEVLLKLISRTNIYISTQKSGKLEANPEVLRKIATWITKMLRMFGLGEGPELQAVGWGEAVGDTNTTLANKEETLEPYLRVLSTFRDSVRELAMKQDVSSKEYLTLCDKVRDEDLVPLGIALDDQEDGRALVKHVSPEVLIRARNEKRAQAEEKAAKKAANQAAEREKRRLQAEKGKIPPAEMFKVGKEGEQYGSWDENGIPLTKADGAELSKSAAKAVKKAWEQQQKRHEDYLKWLQSGEAS